MPQLKMKVNMMAKLIKQLTDQSKQLEEMKATIALYKTEYSTWQPVENSTVPTLYLDPVNVEHIREAAATAQGEVKKVELSKVVPGHRASALDIEIQCVTKPFQCLSRLDLLAYISTGKNRKIMKILYIIVLLLSF